MYKVKVTSQISSAHYLRNYRGRCETLHGHNWKVEVALKSKRLNSIGLVVDFKYLKNILNSILEEIDHKVLNEIDFFKKNNPSCEWLAFYIFKKMEEKLGEKSYYLSEVTVWEQENSCATYYREEEDKTPDKSLE